MSRYQRAGLSDLKVNDEKPGERYEISPELGLSEFNYNIAMLRKGSRLSQNAYHYHENQTEFFHILDGQCRVEVEDGSFDLRPDEFVVFDEDIPHLLHNPYEQSCRVIAIGSPPDGRYPVYQVQSYDDLLEERYGGTISGGECDV